MAGTVNVSRDLWDDPTFKDSEMSQREAWIWMIASASWKPRLKRFGTHEISLLRGQLAASTRFMAKAWGWSEPRVRRYLDMLENRRMITRATDAGMTVITIGKYDQYQNGPRADDAGTARTPAQERRTSDANHKKGEIRVEEDTNVSLSESPTIRGPSFSDFWSVWPLGKIGKKAAEKAFAKLSQQNRQIATERAVSWCTQWKREHPQANPIHPASYLNGERWTDEIQPTFTLIAGGPDGQPTRQDHRAVASADAMRDRLDVVGRMRRSSEPDWLRG